MIDGTYKRCCHHLVDYVAMLCHAEYGRAKAALEWTVDDIKCAKCVISQRAC